MNLSDGTELKELNKAASTFLRGLIIVYGARGSGKTTFVQEVMFFLRNEVEEAYVISQSAEANDHFRDIVPAECIKTDLESKWFEDLLERQKKRSKAYKQYAESLPRLKQLFDKLSKSEERICELNIINKARDLIAELPKRYPDPDMICDQTCGIEKARNEWLAKLYKNTIVTQQHNLDATRMTEDEQATARCVKANPNILIVLDDCAAMLKTWSRNRKIIEAIYNGRHYHMTIIMTTQADTEIDPKIRQNGSITLYTDPTTAAANLARERRNDKKRGELCINAVWRDTSEASRFKKLIYLSDSNDGDPFRFVKLCRRGHFRVGSTDFWRISENVQRSVRLRST